MQLSAQQRYATLQVMGTRLWVPRFQLQGAAVSDVCDWPAPAKQLSARERLLQQQAALKAAQQPPALVPPPQTAAQAVPSIEALAVAPTVVTPVAVTPVAVTPVVVTTTAAVSQTAAITQAPPIVSVQTQPFYADVWLLANGWQLVIENLTGQPGLQAQDIKLLQNLLIALFPGGLGISGQQFFSWPLPGIPVEAGNEGELNMSLQAFLTGARFQGVHLAGCLVFGERLQGLIAESASLPRLFTAPSLTELKHSPTAKQVFWQQAGSSGLRAAFASSPVTL